MRLSKQKWAMSLAYVTSLRSTCIRKRVGCVLLDSDGYVMSTGFNGVPKKTPHCTESPMLCPGRSDSKGKNLEGCYAIHAEQNALLQCSDVGKIDEAYVTAFPCIHCLKMLLNTSCKTIFYMADYHHEDAKSLWISAGRQYVHLPIPLGQTK